MESTLDINYGQSQKPFLYRNTLSENLPTLKRVISLEDRKKAWSLTYLKDNKNISVGKDIKTTWEEGQNSALHSHDITKEQDVETVRTLSKTEWLSGKTFPIFC